MTALCKISLGKYEYSFPEIPTTIVLDKLEIIKIDIIQDIPLNG
jgi:hypothetical protein